MSQLDYNDQSAIAAVKGGLADVGFHDVVSAIADVDVNFGLGLVLTAVEGKVALPSASGQPFAGVAVQRHKAVLNATGTALYEIGDDISVLRRGRIWVNAEQAVDPTQPVYIKFSTADGAGGQVGDFRIDSQVLATLAHASQITNARWVSTTVAAGLAILEINAP